MCSLRRTAAGAACIAAAALGFTTAGAEAAIAQPTKVVVVIMQDRFSEVIGKTWHNGDPGYVMPYVTDLASSSLVYTNSHGATTGSSMLNSMALYAGTYEFYDGNSDSVTIDWRTTLEDRFGSDFAGFTESLPYNGSQAFNGSDGTYWDAYSRKTNPMAMFTEISGGTPVENPWVNKTFNEFLAIGADNDYSDLPTLSYVIPNNLHSTHGRNSGEPWAGSVDENNNDLLRQAADDWLAEFIEPYVQWARANNALLIITQDEEHSTTGLEQDTITTLVTGSTNLFVQGVNDLEYNHYNLLRTLTDMYGKAPLGESANAVPFATDAQGRLTVPEPASLSLIAVSAMMLARRRARRLEGASA